MVILVSKIKGGAVTGCEQLHATAKLGSKVELLGGSKHSMVEVKKAATACEKWLDTPEMYEVYLRTDRAAADTVGIRSATRSGVSVADQRHGNCVENPAHSKRLPRIDEPLVAILDLIISRTDGTRKRVAIFKSSIKPICVFAVGTRPFLCDCRCRKRQYDDNRGGQRRRAVYEPSFSVAM